jgi:putative ABC transport system permease protein
MGTILQDLKYALRMLMKSPGFTAVAIITLALGIGANAAIFTVVNAVLLRPLPFLDPARLVFVVEHSSFPVISTSYENYLDWRDQSHSFVAMEATRGTNMTFTGAGEPERLSARMLTAGLIPLLGVKVAAGRNFLPEEDRAGSAGVAMISYGLWQRRFGGAQSAVGKTIDLDARPYTVVGVLPQGFQILQPADIFVPFHPWARTLPDDRNWHPGILPVARLKPGVTMEQTSVEMKTITKRLEQQYPIYNTGTSASVTGLQEQMVQNVRPALIMLLSAVGFVLLIACVNVANLLLARAASREKEMAVRTALGATRARVVRQLLTESVLLGVAGGAAGLLLARWTLDPLLKLSAGSVPDMGAIVVDHWVLVFTTGISVITGVLFGLVPAWRTSRLDLREVLNVAARGSSSGLGQNRLRAALVVTEIALAMMLMVGAGLLIRSFARIQDTEPGFVPTNLLVADLPLSPTTYSKPTQRFQFFDRLLERARALPGVTSVGAASFLPVSGGGSIIHFNIFGHPPKSAHEYIAAGYRTVSPNYLETLGVPLLKGRAIRDADNEKGPPVVVLNASMAREFFHDENPLGKHIQLGALPDKDVPWMEVVGVVGDVRPGLGVDTQAEMYLPYRQADAVLPVYQLSVVLRTAIDPMAEASALTGAVREIDSNQPLVKVRTMEDNMAVSVAQPRFRTWLLGVFAAVALLLAAVGVYGVMSYSVNQRTNEIGIRVALGAQPVDVFRAVVGQGFRLALVGVGVGLGASLALTRVLQSFLFGVSAIDPVTFGAVALLLTTVGLAASYFPARRATKVDPIVALRYE